MTETSGERLFRDADDPVLQPDGVFHPDMTRSDFRCGYVAIIGMPNVGKSTLLNALLGQKISIVTPKPQTTRHRLLGIVSADAYQVIFLDTPGMLEPRYLLQERMMEHVSLAIGDADVLLLLVDATKTVSSAWLEQDQMVARLKSTGAPAVLIINKIDRVQKLSILPMIEAYARTGLFTEIIPVSALKNDGIAEVLSALIKLLPLHPPLYPADMVSEQSERFFVSEIIREKVFLSCKEEIPYSTAVDIIEFKERGKGKTFIRAEIYVERDSQRGIIIGRDGAMLKKIGAAARRETESILQREVYLELHVKVREEWRRKGEWLDKMGYKTQQ